MFRSIHFVLAVAAGLSLAPNVFAIPAFVPVDPYDIVTLPVRRSIVSSTASVGATTSSSATAAAASSAGSSANSNTNSSNSGLKQIYVALGDSFSAGNRAGNSLDATNCQRTDGSYPYQLKSDPQIVAPGAQFQFLACSGDTTQLIMNTQVNGPITHNGDLYTLTAGGNDVGFEAIVWNCVYNYYWPWASRNCQSLLNNIPNLVAPGTIFDQNLNSILHSLVQETYGPAARFGAQIAMLPYVRFYGSVQSTLWNGCHTTQTLRDQMNAGVDAVNAAVARVVAQNPPAIMVDANDLEEQFDTHRFCDTGTPYIQSNVADLLSADEWNQYQQTGNFTNSTQATLNRLFNGNADGSLTSGGGPADNGNAGNGTDNPLINPGLFHPNQAGYTAYYESLKAALSPAAS